MKLSSRYRIGIDVGGTFTDLVIWDSKNGTTKTLKTPTTPPAFADGVMVGIQQTKIPANDINEIVHGMTVATNTALEMNGAKLGVITTKGFRDVLVVGRGNRTVLYDIKAVRPPPLVQRARILEVKERITAQGKICIALDEHEVAVACKRLLAMDVEAIAICFLHSYANPKHEQRAAEIIRNELPGIPVSVSSEILPEYREFERFSTTALNAYVGPKVTHYLNHLSTKLKQHGIVAPLRIMGSNGGNWSAAAMAEKPVNALLSGPAGGVSASLGIARLLNIPNIITYDMGGTSTDACLIRNFEYGMTNEGHVGMWPNRAPQIEIKSVGAGGGSIAYLDQGSFLNVGPRSAGAIPGPACYGKGGNEPTVTDANVVLGRFRPDNALGGAIDLDQAAAYSVIKGFGETLGLSPENTADGILRLAVARMTATVKEISIMRGFDPRDFTLFAYGGAGPLHAAAIAEELGMDSIMIPPMSGTFSAYGLLTADTRYDVTRTKLILLADTSLKELDKIIQSLKEEAIIRLKHDGFLERDIRTQVFLDMRFVGQAFELTTAIPDSPKSLEQITNAFETAYEQRYSQRDTGPIEIVSFRVVGFGGSHIIELQNFHSDGLQSPILRDVWFNGRFVGTPIMQRNNLPTRELNLGPMIIEESGATTVVPPGFSITADKNGILAMRRSNDA